MSSFILLPVGGVVLGWLQEMVEAYKKREADERDRRENRFMDSVNISLNYIENNQLRFRTLCEVPLDLLL